ncbi:MAG: hypothetical protein H8D23_26970 [Candidatus Brocadiales bacterium]|nr:hypothetical protein [Candidatus Brocadiales bacterium]
MDINWKHADNHDLRVFNAIRKILKGYEKLLVFLFHTTEARLTSSPKHLLEQAKCFSSREYILIKVCLDLWDPHSGGTLLPDIVSLDRRLYLRILQAIECIYWS